MVGPRKIEPLDDAMVATLRTKTPAERLAMAFDCSRTVRVLIADQSRSPPFWVGRRER